MISKKLVVMLTACIFMWCAIAGSVMISVGAMRVTRAQAGDGPPWVLDFRYVSTGAAHSLGVTMDGRLFTWGFNGFGQLGVGTAGFEDGRYVPVHIMSGTTFSAVSAGSQHSLGMTTDGRLFSWGSNSFGQLGDETTTDRYTPVHIMSGTTFSSVSAGGSHSLGITTDGRLFAWGFNQSGQIGDGTRGIENDRSTPVHVMSGTTFSSVSAGGSHSLGITTDGRLFAWGSNHSGQIGDGTRGLLNDRSTPVHIMPETSFSSASASFNHSIGLTSDGRLFAWGNNNNGQLGDGTTTERHTPVHIMSGTTFSSAQGGSNNSFGITPDGRLFAWGSNNHGQLGDGTTTQRDTPVHIMSGTTFRLVSGGTHSLGITTDGRLLAWGHNFFGQTGDGTTIERHVPTSIARPLNAQDLQTMIDELRAQAQIDRNAIAALQNQLEDFMLKMQEALQGQGDRITALENRMTVVENDLDNLGEQISDIHESLEIIDDIKDRINKMEGDLELIDREGLVLMIEDLEELLEDLQKEIAGLDDFLVDPDLNEIRAKIAALELALGNLDLNLETEEVRTQLQTILDDILDDVLSGKLSLLTNRLSTVEYEIESLLYELEEIIAEIIANMAPTAPTPTSGRNNEMLLYIGIAVLVLGLFMMIVGAGIAVFAGKRSLR